MKKIESKFGFFISIILSLIGIYSTIYFSNGDTKDFIDKIALPITIFSLAIIISVITYRLYLKRIQIEFFKDRKRVPRIFEVDKMLTYIAKKGYNLSVVGRTNISWFNLDEKRIQLYQKAIANGCKITFIIQHEFVKNKNLTNSKVIKAIKKDYSTVLINYEKLIEKIDKKNRIRLLLTNKAIENSMSKVYSNSESIKYFSYDISQNIEEKPFIVFWNDSVFEELKNKFNFFINNSISLIDYKEKKIKASNEISQLKDNYSQFSTQRENDNNKLVYHFFDYKKAEKEGYNKPPVSIQLLLTNDCTSRCIMCNHYEMSSQNELSKTELESIIYYIKDIGTKNIIISGGEPFRKKYCLDIIDFARKLDLNIGLLTNGIKSGNNCINSNDAKRLKASCDWVQLSIDSFNPETYKHIRRNDLSIVLDSLNNLEKEGTNLEICFTIQRDNIDEAINLVKGNLNKPTRAPIRFKFAHGPDKNDKFLLSNAQDISKLKDFLIHCRNSNDFNTQYILDMFTKEYFTPEDITLGTPLKSRNKHFKFNGYNCHIFNYSCKIDAKGNVYPCCFLFDDNQGESSKIRTSHKLGSLRSNSGVVELPENGHNKLREVLFESNKLMPYKNLIIPIDDDACNNCTRHFYQNEFLNKLESIANEYESIHWEPQIEGDVSKMWI